MAEDLREGDNVHLTKVFLRVYLTPILVDVLTS